MENSVKDDPTLSWYISQFDEAADQSIDARTNAEIYRDYYDGKQYTDEEKAALKERGQPVVTDNRIKDKVEYLCGTELKVRTDPKAYPRTPKDEMGAELATDALRYIADCNHFPHVKSKVFENLCVEGMGGCEVIVEQYGNGNPKIRQRYIRWDRLYYDPYSMLADFSDMRYCGIVAWMDADEAKTKSPDHSELIDVMMSDADKSLGTSGETYDDKPRWVDRKRKRVQVLEHYLKRGDTWHRVVFAKFGIIEAEAPVVYIDSETGKPECPLILQSLYVDRIGQRYGVIQRYKDLQDEINKRRSKSLHLLSVANIVTEKGAVEDIDAARKQIAKPDGAVEVTPGMRFDVDRHTDLATGQFQLLQDAINSMGEAGPNEAQLGNSGSVSGRAKMIDQNAGDVKNAPLIEQLRHWQSRVMRSTWNRVKQFWTQEQWIRVTDDERSKFMVMNAPDPRNPNKQPVMVAQLDVDIIIDEMPDVVTIQQEQFETLASLAEKGFPIPPDVLIEASGIRNKQRLLDRMSGKIDDTKIPPEVRAFLQQKEQEIAQKTELLKQAEEETMQKVQEAQNQETTAKNAQMQAQAKVQEIESKIGELENILVKLDVEQMKLDAHKAKLDARATEVKAMESVATTNLELEVMKHTQAMQQKESDADDRIKQKEESSKIDVEDIRSSLAAVAQELLAIKSRPRVTRVESRTENGRLVAVPIYEGSGTIQ